MGYEDDSIQPDYSVNFGVNIGGGQPISANVNGNVSTPGACVNCGQNKFLSFSFPIILVVIAVLVLAFRK